MMGNSVKIVEVSHVAPSQDSPSNSKADFSLQLTFLDTLCLKFHPGEFLFFYPFTASAPPSSFSSILSALKHSLSLTLLNFLPLAGNLTWPPHSDKPFLLYAPGDAVSLTLAESDADFERVSGNQAREAVETRPFVPSLTITETEASVIALQITLFPQSGFCIGVTFHHAALDGASLTMFLKSWACACGRENPTPDLTPFYDRTVIKDPAGLDLLYLNRWVQKTASSKRGNPRGFEFWSELKLAPNLVRQDFDLSLADAEKLRKTVLIRLENTTPVLYLSTFVLVCAYVVVCLVKAKGNSRESERKIYLVLNADYRARLDPPVPQNYFGNCIGSHLVALEEAECMEEDGVATVAENIGKVVKGLENGVLEGAEERLSKWGSLEAGAQVIGVSGSHRFGLYGLDFGWGKPRKMEITSIDRNGAFSMAESKDGSGGVEIGLVLNEHEMELFGSLFHTGLEKL